MTPAQKVAVDAMREAWEPEVVERMLRAEDGRIEAAVLVVDAWLSAKFVHLDLTGDMADDATIAAAQSSIEDTAQKQLTIAFESIRDARALADQGCEELQFEIEQAFRDGFSIVEMPAGESVDHPEDETEEDASWLDPHQSHCVQCGTEIDQNEALCDDCRF